MSNVIPFNKPYKIPKWDYPTDRATEYAHRVLDKEIIAGPFVRMACARHLHDIRTSGARNLVWDEKAVERILGYYANVLVIPDRDVDGEDFNMFSKPLPFVPLDWQAFCLGSIYGWKNSKTGRRRFNRGLIETAKGSGKTPMGAGMCLYHLHSDGVRRPDVFIGAVHRRQAGVAFKDAVAMVNAQPALSRRLRIVGGDVTPNIIARRDKSGEMRVMSKDAGSKGKGMSGHRITFALADELHEHPNSFMIEQFFSGMKCKEPLLISITNSGAGATSACGIEHGMGLNAIKSIPEKGRVAEDSYFAYICALDNGDDWKDEDVWPKTNPGLPIAPDYEYLRLNLALGSTSPSKRAEILRKHMCVWSNQTNPWIDETVWESLQYDLSPIKQRKKRPCYMALDLSRKNDFTAGVLVWAMEDGTFEVETVVWTPEATLTERSQTDNTPYQEWVDLGHLTTTPGRTVKFKTVAEWIAQVNKRYNLQGIAYDAWHMDDIVDELLELDVKVTQIPSENGILIVPHQQGTTIRKAPAESRSRKRKKEQNIPVLSMPISIDRTEELIIDERLIVKENVALTSAVLGAKVIEGSSGNRAFTKKNVTTRIDACVAMVMAIGYATAPKPKKVKKWSAQDTKDWASGRLDKPKNS